MPRKRPLENSLLLKENIQKEIIIAESIMKEELKEMISNEIIEIDNDEDNEEIDCRSLVALPIEDVQNEIRLLEFKKIAYTYKKEELDKLLEDLNYVIYMNNHEIIKIEYLIKKLSMDII